MSTVKTETTVREWDASGKLLSEKVTTVEDRTPRTTTETSSDTDLSSRRAAGFSA